MPHSAPLSQLGQYIVTFQAIEAHLTELLSLIVEADEEYIHILVNELDFGARLRATDVAFSRFVDLNVIADKKAPAAFHKVIGSIQKLSERRNELVHSTYSFLVTTEKIVGLVRNNSKLRASKGLRVV